MERRPRHDHRSLRRTAGRPGKTDASASERTRLTNIGLQIRAIFL
ncbi:unnamed protein product [Ciceribacter selenitireducens ATCC BAA-1503]|uniref:Uncharacterized protein n=1 Tax=Ciceribacter selenitireducens ATCC BAA-1503 TaxID=1336235 RepID=A0A376AAU4_9HYPH|nr:unnamed protein product [Ciceribacter selenitireducens ATCC BAA-1503]